MKILQLSFLTLVGCLIAQLLIAQGDPTVYVTKTGSKYHRAGCSSLSKSSIPMKLSEASARYSPCSRCKPPTMSSEKSDTRIQTAEKDSAAPAIRPDAKGKVIGETPTGKTLYQGPRGGTYYYSKSGKKVYVKRK